MKNWLFLLLFPLAATGQNMPGPEGKFIYDLTYDFLVPSSPVDNLQQQWYSNGHSFSFMGESTIIDGLGIGYGFGFSIHNLHNNLAFVEVQPDPLDAGVLTLAKDSAFQINKQNLAYFDIPVEIRFRGRSTPKGWFFRASAGVKAGYRIAGSAYHRVGDYALRQYRVFESSPFRLKAYARVGVGKVTLYAGYEIRPTLVEQWPGFVPENYEPIQFRMASIGLSLVL